MERTASFQRLLERHQSRPGRPADAGRKAERILTVLAAGDGLCPWEAGALTRWGDARLPGCLKYELGGGYRLVCRRRGGVLVALFLGNHEECHNWFRASRVPDVDLEIRAAAPAAPEKPDDEAPFGRSPEFPERALTDLELRKVFAGLCRG